MRITAHLFTAIVSTLALSCIAAYTNKESSKSTKILFKIINSILGTDENERPPPRQEGYGNPDVAFVNPYPYQHPGPHRPSPSFGIHGEYHNVPPNQVGSTPSFYHNGPVSPFGSIHGEYHNVPPNRVGPAPGFYHNGPILPFGGSSLPMSGGGALGHVTHSGQDGGFSNGNAYGPVSNSLASTGASDGNTCPETGCTIAGGLPQYQGPPAQIDETAVSGAGQLDVRSSYPKQPIDEANNSGEINAGIRFTQQPPYPRPTVEGFGTGTNRPVLVPGHSTQHHHIHHHYNPEYERNSHTSGSF